MGLQKTRCISFAFHYNGGHSFDYKYRNLSGFVCLMLIRAIVLFATDLEFFLGETIFRHQCPFFKLLGSF